MTHQKTDRFKPSTNLQRNGEIEHEQQSNIEIVRPRNIGNYCYYPRRVTVNSHEPWKSKYPAETA